MKFRSGRVTAAVKIGSSVDKHGWRNWWSRYVTSHRAEPHYFFICCYFQYQFSQHTEHTGTLISCDGSVCTWRRQTGGESVMWAMLNRNTTVISGFRRVGDEKCVLLGCCAASSGNSLPTFRDNLSVPYSRVKNPTKILRLLILEYGTDRLPETSVRNYHYSLLKR